MTAKAALATLLRRSGLVVTRTRSTDPWYAVAGLLRDEKPVIFDVGANVGQTATHCAKTLPGSEISCFEPSPSTFDQLNTVVGGLSNVHAFNAGMGSQDGKLRLRENTNSVMSSFLLPGPAAWGSVVRESLVDVWTVDGFSEKHRIERVTVLKTDTQGFDLEVLRGAEQMIRGSALDMISCRAHVRVDVRRCSPFRHACDPRA